MVELDTITTREKAAEIANNHHKENGFIDLQSVEFVSGAAADEFFAIHKELNSPIYLSRDIYGMFDAIAKRRDGIANTKLDGNNRFKTIHD